jgi:hypothetical protein
MKLFTMFVVIAIWVFLTIHLPVKAIPFNPFLGLYLVANILFSITKLVYFLVWNFYSVEEN